MRGYLYSKFSFGAVYFQINGRKFSFTVKCEHDFQTYIGQYTASNENNEHGYPHSDTLHQFCLKFEGCKPQKSARDPTTCVCDVINDVKLFPTVYCRMYCCKFLTSSNQTSRYKIKCIRIVILRSKLLLNWTCDHNT